MVHVNPPYRCDVVGSFLRPKTVAQARVKFSCGQISKEELTAIEDAEIKKLIAKERENGLSAVTDGEFRRATGIWTFWRLSAVFVTSKPRPGRCISKVISPKPRPS